MWVVSSAVGKLLITISSKRYRKYCSDYMYVTAAGMKIDIIQHRVSLVIKLRAEMFVFTRSVAHFQSVLLLSDHHRHGVSVHHLEETEAEE